MGSEIPHLQTDITHYSPSLWIYTRLALTAVVLRGSGEGWASALELRRFIRSF
jgi:hypothetical protein